MRVQFNNHPALMRIVCLAEAYRNDERAIESGKPEATVTLNATRRMLDQQLREWRQAIDKDPSAFTVEEFAEDQ